MMRAERVADFLAHRFTDIARGSGVKRYLSQPNKFGWDAKRKLVWLGPHSCLFHNGFQNYASAHTGTWLISLIDDFVCEHTNGWSGLGAIGILAAILDVTDQQREDLRNWCCRHLAYFKVLDVTGLVTIVENINQRQVLFSQNTWQCEAH